MKRTAHARCVAVGWRHHEATKYLDPLRAEAREDCDACGVTLHQRNVAVAS